MFAETSLPVELTLRSGEIPDRQTTGDRPHAHGVSRIFPEAARKRRLVRLWMRARGKRGYQG